MMNSVKNRFDKFGGVFVCFFIIFSLTIPIFADDMPENIVSGSLTIDKVTVHYTDRDLELIPDQAAAFDISYGTMNLFNIVSMSADTIEDVSVSVTFTLDNMSSFYLPWYISVQGNTMPTVYQVEVNGLEDYFYNQIQPTYSGSYNLYTLATTSNQVSSSTQNGTWVVNFKIYSSVPAGTYTFNFTPAIVNTGTMTGNTFPIGFYVSSYNEGTGLPPDPVGDYINGDITYDEAVQQIKDQMNAVLNDITSTDFQKQMAIADAQAKLEELKDASDVKYNTVVKEFASSTEEVVNNFIESGSTDPDPYINNLQTLYTDALTQATTPEQGTFINTQFNVALSQMQTIWHANYKTELDEVITNEEIEASEEKRTELESKMELEQKIIDDFVNSEYQAQLKFDLWATELAGQYDIYRSIFDYIITDENSVFRFYIQVPIAVTLIAVILATTNVIIRRSRNG